MANGGRGNLCVWLMRVGVKRFSSTILLAYKVFLLTNFHVLEKNNR